jgi:tryptophan 2,3-dioxygenase
MHEAFPYDAVLAAFHRVGKHFAPADLLAELDRVRTVQGGHDLVLDRFLFTALDKYDGRFDNPSYLAIELLDLPGGTDVAAAATRRDRLVAGLLTDLIDFETAAAEGRTEMLPQMRPSARVAQKRCHHASRVLGPIFDRLTSPLTDEELQLVRLSMIPVSLVHDEYMFIRVLQAYEATFALIAVYLTAAVAAIEDEDAPAAAELVDASERVFRESKPLFSLVATMQPEAFLAFREFTDGASAIQSRNYKLIESLCKRPERERLDSPAYLSVAPVRERVLAGLPNLSEALAHADVERDAIDAAMDRFEAVLLEWRLTHYRMAVRMLGERRGTGYTAGVPYLDQGRKAPVFAMAA